jgi:hypothetical protein
MWLDKWCGFCFEHTEIKPEARRSFQRPEDKNVSTLQTGMIQLQTFGTSCVLVQSVVPTGSVKEVCENLEE